MNIIQSYLRIVIIIYNLTLAYWAWHHPIYKIKGCGNECDNFMRKPEFVRSKVISNADETNYKNILSCFFGHSQVGPGKEVHDVLQGDKVGQ